MSKSRLHFMGIGGQGISAVAQMAHMGGGIVSGCDQRESATVRALRAAGISIQIGHEASHLDDVDVLVISPAVPALDPQNPELLAARERGLRVVTWQEILGELMLGSCVLSVSGVHGKGTTTSMLALMLLDAGLDPTCEIGAVVPRFGANYRLGRSQYFVNEADEFNHNFWHYHPRLAIVTSIEFEHPEFFPDYSAFLQAFVHFIRGMELEHDWPVPATLILNADSAGCFDLLALLVDWPGQVMLYSLHGLSTHPRAVASLEAHAVQLDGQTSFRVRASGNISFPEDLVLKLALPGRHNIENALAALTAARVLGIDPAAIQRTLQEFTGTKRRFDIRQRGLLSVNGREIDVMLVDDYAHHPTAIAATLEATHQRYPDRRIIAVYQPHMFSRTKTFFDQFLRAFDAADLVLLSDIFPARERDTGLISSRDLVDGLRKQAAFVDRAERVIYGGNVTETTRLLSEMLQTGDLAVIMGAGDIYTVTEMILNNAVAATEA